MREQAREQRAAEHDKDNLNGVVKREDHRPYSFTPFV
jgi:hypothetical protein